MSKDSENLKERSQISFAGIDRSHFNGEAIILAGGLGTRLQGLLPGIPKCMAPVAGRPFLFYVINYLRSQGVEKFIFSLGHLHEMIEAWLAAQFPTLQYESVIEKLPLGTGGAIKLAMEKAIGKKVLVVNGDTLFRFDLERLLSFDHDKKAECTIVLKPMNDFERYGVVELNEDGSVKKFQEKKFYHSGLVNGGIYMISKKQMESTTLPEKFSFEKEWLEKKETGLYGFIQDAYFIDIGIPEDYARAQQELRSPPLDLKSINESWTLFIDRDGVINQEKPDGYIQSKEEFQLYEGVQDAFLKMATVFGKIIVISNQRGVGKGLMTEDELENIHIYMKNEIEANGGRIDAIYYCTSADDLHPDRKPNPGMAFKAKKDFPAIDLSRTIMIGNKAGDMRFARNAGSYSVYLRTTHPEQTYPDPDIDLQFNSLPEFAKALPGK